MIAEAVHAGAPFWGVCLGAQLLAASLGGEVAPGHGPEVGVLPVHLTGEAASDEVFAAAPESFQAFQWHGDTYGLPPGATRLAYSELYEQQAFVFRRAYALQFHIEVGPDLVAEWGAVPAYASSLAALGGEDALGELVEVCRTRAGTFQGAGALALQSLARARRRLPADLIVSPARSRRGRCGAGGRSRRARCRRARACAGCR